MVGRAAECGGSTVVAERPELGRLDERALDAVWADPDLLALEFEAIMSANYATSADRPDRRPPPRRRAAMTRRAPAPGQVERWGRRRTPARTRPTGRRALARERGPHARQNDHTSSVDHACQTIDAEEAIPPEVIDRPVAPPRRGHGRCSAATCTQLLR